MTGPELAAPHLAAPHLALPDLAWWAPARGGRR
jgi:hypothetical protein